MENTETITPILSNCRGVITSKDSERNLLMVLIYNSPMGRFQGSVPCTYDYVPGLARYKVGDVVTVQANFMFNTDTQQYVGSNARTYHVTGIFQESTVYNATDNNALTTIRNNDDSVRAFVHDENGAGMIVFAGGRVRIGTTGVTHREFIPGGFGIYKEADVAFAQNFHRDLAGFEGGNVAKEHFGLYTGGSLAEEAANAAPDNQAFVYRRFVPSDKTLDKWTSVCEGSFNPFMGPNNNKDKDVKGSRDTVYYRVVQNKLTRATVDMGEPGDGFITMRIDTVALNETAPVNKATPALIGNISMIKLGDDGTVSIKANAKKTPGVALHDLSIDYDGKDLAVNCGGKISFGHGTGSEAMNSLVLDPTAGVDFKAMNGLRVNGKTLMTEDFLAWFDKNKTALCQVTQVGGPAPLFPAALATFSVGAALPQVAGGFTTDNVGAPAIGVNTTPDVYMTV